MDVMILEDMWVLKSVNGKTDIELLMDPKVYAECLDENCRFTPELLVWSCLA